MREHNEAFSRKLMRDTSSARLSERQRGNGNGRKMFEFNENTKYVCYGYGHAAEIEMNKKNRNLNRRIEMNQRAQRIYQNEKKR